ncbi:MAG: TetR/AcrR family transcriptional regulator [Clostridia bacterium]|nr:TetR/AcrR family transcriptional regulator [Clostridia bacterium]
MNKQPEVTEQTRKNLIAACFDLIKRQGKATVNEITKAAGYNRCTFYRYFTDARQLLDIVEDEICENLGNAVCQASTDSTEETMDAFAAVYTTYGSYISVLLGEHGDPVFRTKMRKIAEPAIIKRFHISAENEAEAALKTEYIISAALGTIIRWYDLDMPISTRKLAELIVGVASHGIM